jgi:hypothetical protein
MALTKADVLNTLSDPVLSRMNFWVGAVHLSQHEFGIIREHILHDNIKVVEGTNSWGQYSSANDTLTTQNVSPPPDLDARGLLLHECSHAVVDVFDLHVFRLTDEAAAYIAQHTYLLLSNPAWVVGSNNAPWFKFFQDVVALVKKFKLHLPAGYGARVPEKEIEILRTQMPVLPGDLYKDVKADDPTGADGLRNPYLFTDDPVETSTRTSGVAHETYPDPSDGYLADLLGRRYAKTDVAGYGGRVKELESVFRRVSQPKAINLYVRLSSRLPGDKVSMYFHDHLSTKTRTRMLEILKSKI